MDIQVFVNELFAKKVYLFELPITIDGLSVVLHADLEEGSIWVQSDDTDETLYEFTEDTELTVESIISTIQKILEKLDQLYYYKPMGKLLSRDDNMDLLKYIVFKKFAKKNEDCSICFEETSVFTQCKHYCCHKCLEKITLCPICRRTL
jgi:hypothetical protein